MAPTEKTTSEILQDTLENVSDLFRKELELAKAETREEMRKAAKGAVLGAAGLLFAVFGIHFLLWTLVWALAPELPNWAASLIVAVVTLVVAAVLGVVAKNIFKTVQPAPTRAARQAKETVTWAKN